MPSESALMARPEVGFDRGTGKVRIRPIISAEAGLGPYTVEVQAESPVHLSGMLRPETAQGTVAVAGRKYRYSADLQFKVDVVLQPRPDGRDGEPVGVKKTQTEKVPATDSNTATDWHKIREETKEISVIVTWAIIGTILAWYARTAAIINQTTSVQPFMHTLGFDDPMHLKNPEMI